MWTKVLVTAVAALLAGTTMAQQWPVKPIRVLIGFNAGTSPDLLARVAGTEMAKHLGQAILVESRPGAAGGLANVAVASAAPDGYTLVLGSFTSSHPTFSKSSPMVLGKDLAPVGNIAATPVVLFVRGGLGVKIFQDLVALSKANPNKLNFGPTANHYEVLAALLRLKTGLSYTPVRYKGAPVAEMLRGETDFYIGSFSGLAAHIQAGKIMPLLIMSKEEAYPNVENAVDLGFLKGPLRGNYGYSGPMGIPRDVVRRFNEAMLAATRSPEVIEGIKKLGLDVRYSNAEQQLQEYEAVIAQLGEVARATNYVPED